MTYIVSRVFGKFRVPRRSYLRSTKRVLQRLASYKHKVTPEQHESLGSCDVTDVVCGASGKFQEEVNYVVSSVSGKLQAEVNNRAARTSCKLSEELETVAACVSCKCQDEVRSVCSKPSFKFLRDLN